MGAKYWRKTINEKKEYFIETKTKGRRVLLTELSTRLLEKEVKNFKEKSCRINLSQLVNEIIENCLEKSIKIISEEIESKYLDRKMYAKRLLEADTEESFQQALGDLKKKFKLRRKKEVNNEAL